MAQKASRDVENFTYVLQSDQQLPIAEQSTFRFRPLIQGERVRLIDGMEVVLIDPSTKARAIKPCGIQQAYEVVLLSLVAVDNFPGGAAEAYPVDRGREACVRYLEAIDDYQIIELGQYAINRATLGPPEKNSSTP